MSTTTTLPNPNLPNPAGAYRIEDWSDGSRYFETPHILIPVSGGGVAVFTAGFQQHDGSTRREVCVNQLHPDTPLTVSQARQIARALMAAADAVERWQTDTGEVPPANN